MTWRGSIEESHLIRLAIEDQRRLADLLPDPPEPSPALRRVGQAHERLVPTVQ